MKKNVENTFKNLVKHHATKYFAFYKIKQYHGITFKHGFDRITRNL